MIIMQLPKDHPIWFVTKCLSAAFLLGIYFFVDNAHHTDIADVGAGVGSGITGIMVRDLVKSVFTTS